MLGKLFSRDPIEGFWKWFVPNAKDLAEVSTGSERVFTECLRRIKLINEGLTVQLTPEFDGVRHWR